MSESALSTATADALSGTANSTLDITYETIASEYYSQAYKNAAIRDRILGQLPSQLRVFKDGTLTYGVRAGSFRNGATLVNYAAAAAQALTDDATNYIYLTESGVLTVSTSAFPTTPHVPLAEVKTGSASAATTSATYAHVDITDRRCRAAFCSGGGVTISAAAEDGSSERAITIETGGNRRLVRFWVATADYGAPSATDNTASVDTGTTKETITANADYDIISDATGTVVVGLIAAGAVSRYIMVEVDGIIYSSGELTWAA